MYFILESYVDVDEQGNEQGFVLPVHTQTDFMQAKSIYHSIMASAMLSTHRYHGATIFNESMEQLLRDVAQHFPEPEPEE